MTIEIEIIDKCQLCTHSICCTYTSEALGTLRSKDDFEHVLWQVSHQNIEVYRDDEGWFLLFRGTCEHLQNNGNCGIYETRPKICRTYKNDYCEYDEPAENHFINHFKNYQELLSYCKKRFKRWDA